jgi:hypothetical protein
MPNYDLPNTCGGRDEWIVRGFTVTEDVCWFALWRQVFSPEETFTWRAAFRAAGL